MTPMRPVAHVVQLNLAWAQKSVELTRRRKRFDWTIFSAVRVHVEVDFPMKVN